MSQSRLKRGSLALLIILIISTVVISGILSLPVAAQERVVEENKVDIGGTTITVNTNQTNSIAVTELPEDATVLNISESGTYNKNENSILYSNFGSGLPAQVTFTLDPDDNAYNSGSDSLDFVVDGESVSLSVTNSANSSPTTSNNNKDTSVDEQTSSTNDEDTSPVNKNNTTESIQGSEETDQNSTESTQGSEETDQNSTESTQGSDNIIDDSTPGFSIFTVIVCFLCSIIISSSISQRI